MVRWFGNKQESHTTDDQKKPFTIKIRQKFMLDLKPILYLSLYSGQTAIDFVFLLVSPSEMSSTNADTVRWFGNIFKKHVNHLVGSLHWTRLRLRPQSEQRPERRVRGDGAAEVGGAAPKARLAEAWIRKEIYWPKNIRRKFRSQFTWYIVHESISMKKSTEIFARESIYKNNSF